MQINPLNAELNPICHLLALVGTHHIVHVSRIGVKKWRRERKGALKKGLGVGGKGVRPGAQYGRNAYSSTIRIHSIRTRAELWEFRDVNYRVSREVSAVDIKAFQKAGLLHNYRLPTFGLNFLYLCRHSKNAALLVSQLETPSNDKLIREKRIGRDA